MELKQIKVNGKRLRSTLEELASRLASIETMITPGHQTQQLVSAKNQ